MLEFCQVKTQKPILFAEKGKKKSLNESSGFIFLPFAIAKRNNCCCPSLPIHNILS